MRLRKFIISALAVANILVGLVICITLLLMNWAYASLLGILLIVFGVAMLMKYFFNLLLYFGIIPLTLFYTIAILLTGPIQKIPSGEQPLVKVALSLTVFLWGLVIADTYLIREMH